MTTKLLGFCVLPLLALGMQIPPAEGQTPATLVQFLTDGVALDAGQLAKVEKGQPVVKQLDTKEKADVAVFGIITINATRDAYVARVKDFQKSLKTPTRTSFGIFGEPASAADVQTLVVDSQDVADLRSCKAGECKLKIPAAVMAEVRQEMSAGDARAATNAYARKRVVEYINDYRARGDAAMVVYDDRGNTHASQAFASLLDQSPYIYQYVPTLHQY